MSDNVREYSKLAAWVVGGMVVGLGLGMLYAPQSGQDARRSVARRAKRAQLDAIRVGRAVQSGVDGVKKAFVAMGHSQTMDEAA